MSKHTFTIDIECDSEESYVEFVSTVGSLGGEITNEESDYNG